MFLPSCFRQVCISSPTLGRHVSPTGEGGSCAVRFAGGEAAQKRGSWGCDVAPPQWQSPELSMQTCGSDYTVNTSGWLQLNGLQLCRIISLWFDFLSPHAPFLSQTFLCHLKLPSSYITELQANWKLFQSLLLLTCFLLQRIRADIVRSIASFKKEHLMQFNSIMQFCSGVSAPLFFVFFSHLCPKDRICWISAEHHSIKRKTCQAT